MRVAIVGTAADSLVRFRGSVIREMVSQGFEVDAYACCLTKLEAERIQQLGARPVSLSIDRSSVNPFKDLWTCIELYRHFKKNKYDIFFGYTAKPVIFGGAAAFAAGIEKKIGMLEGLGYCFTECPGRVSLKKSVLKWVQVLLFKLSLPLLDKVLFLNEDDSNELREICDVKIKKSIVFGPIGLDLSIFPFEEQPKDSFTFLFVGRLLKEKGIREFALAAQRIFQVAPNVKFVVVGAIDTSNPSSLTNEEIKEFKKLSNIEFVGATEDVQRHIKQSNVFVLPSYREGYSRSVQEAMAMGRAIITTDAPGCRDSIVNGINGILIKTADVDSLFEAMLVFVNEKEKASVMGKESFLIAQKRFNEVERSGVFVELLSTL